MQSIGNLATKDGLIVFAGVNSSVKDQDAGKNEHLRSFEVRYPPRKKQKTEEVDEPRKGNWKALGKRPLFRPSTAAKKETYQRILRLSPSQKREPGNMRIGAVATGLAPKEDSQVVVFNATNPTPETPDILARIDLPEGVEAADLDIAETAPSEFSVAYCTDYDIYEQAYKYDFNRKRTEKTPRGPRRVHQMALPDTLQEPGSRPKFRCLRFLNSQNIVALCNKPNKKGAELRVYHLYPTGPSIMIQQKNLPSHIKQAVTMDVCGLDPDEQGNQQVVVAVAGQDISVEVFTTNYQRQTETFTPFKSYLTMKDVHEHQMTKICFSPFHSPTQDLRAEKSKKGKGGKSGQQQSPSSTSLAKQYIQLSSVSYGNTVVVDTFPVQPLDSKNKTSRYVLSHPSDEAWTKWAYIIIISGIVLVFAFLLQSFVGFGDNQNLGPFNLLPSKFRAFLDAPAAAAYGRGRMVEETISSVIDQSVPTNIPGKSRLQRMISTHLSSHPEAGGKQKALIIRSAPDNTGGVTVDVHPDKEAYLEGDKDAKHWEELEEEQKTRWKERLMQAGEWAEGEGEKVLIGLLFSEYAGIVREAAREVIREL